MDLEIPNAFLIVLCDKCGKEHASIRPCFGSDEPYDFLAQDDFDPFG